MATCNPNDILGTQVGRWTIISLCPEKDRHGFYQYLCKCGCGTEKVILRQSLLSGKSQSCGCLNKELSSVRTLKRHKDEVADFIGKIFGRLKVIKVADELNSDGKYNYICECECGNIINVYKNNLVSGATRSCGCLNSETLIERHKLYRDSFDHESYIGEIFSKLTIIEYSGYKKGMGQCFKCLCSCGNIKEWVRLKDLNSGNVKSCGCLHMKSYSDSLDEYERQINKRERDKFSKSQVRLNVLERDNYTCFLCHQNHDVRLEVHHIEPWKMAEDLRFEADNLITLCSECHFNFAHCGFVGQGVDVDLTEDFKNYIISKKEIYDDSSNQNTKKDVLV